MATAKQLDWLDCDESFSRGKKIASGSVNYAMRTDLQVKLELLRIINGGDKLHCKYIITKCYVNRELAFSQATL